MPIMNRLIAKPEGSTEQSIVSLNEAHSQARLLVSNLVKSREKICEVLHKQS